MPSKRTGHDEGGKSNKGEGKKKGGRPKLDPSVHRVQRTITLGPDIDARVTLRMMETGQSLASVVEDSLRQTLPPIPRGGLLRPPTPQQPLDTSQVDTKQLLESLLEALLEKTKEVQQSPVPKPRKHNNKKTT